MLDNIRFKTYHLYGKHEEPVNHFKFVKNGKGFTNFGCSAEVIMILKSIREI